MPTYLRTRHKCDLYVPTIATNAAGQRKSTFSLSSSSVPCDYVPKYATFRVTPTVEEQEVIKIFFKNTTTIDYQYRVTNIKDRFNTVIDSGTFEVIEILKPTGFQGKIHHIECRVRRVAE